MLSVAQEIFQIQQLGYTPIKKALDFYKSGLEATERLWLGGIRSRKTTSILFEHVCHATGIYPPWWPGYRYNRPVNIAFLTVDEKKCYELFIEYLLRGDHVAGLSPMLSEALIDYKKSKRSNSLSGSYFSLAVKHATGGYSYIRFGSYHQGARSHQSVRYDIVHLDESPDYKLYLELVGRITPMDKEKTFVTIATWPEFGLDEFVASFWDVLEPGVAKNDKFLIQSGWDDNPSFTEEDIERMSKRFPDWQLPARRYGDPTCGSGKVFTFDLNRIKTDILPASSPDHFRIYAIDPARSQNGFWGFVSGIYDPNEDSLIIDKDYLKSGLTTLEHINNINALIEPWWPGVVDYAGAGEDLRTLETAYNLMTSCGLDLRKVKKENGSKEADISEILSRVRSGKIFISNTCVNLLREMTLYSRDEKNKIIKKNDHTVDALFYLVRSLKYAANYNKADAHSRYLSSKDEVKYLSIF